MGQPDTSNWEATPEVTPVIESHPDSTSKHEEVIAEDPIVNDETNEVVDEP